MLEKLLARLAKTPSPASTKVTAVNISRVATDAAWRQLRPSSSESSTMP